MNGFKTQGVLFIARREIGMYGEMEEVKTESDHPIIGNQ